MENRHLYIKLEMEKPNQPILTSTVDYFYLEPEMVKNYDSNITFSKLRSLAFPDNFIVSISNSLNKVLNSKISPSADDLTS